MSNIYGSGYTPSSPRWQSYTMTIGASTTPPTKATTVVVDEARWRKVGDSMEIVYNYRHTTSTGSVAGSGNYLFPLPAGYTIDTTKVSVGGTALSSNCGVLAAKSGTTNGIGTVQVFDSTRLLLAVMTDTLAVGIVASGFFQMTSTEAIYSFRAVVPITGW